MISRWGIPYHAVFGVTDADLHDPTLQAFLPKDHTNLGAIEIQWLAEKVRTHDIDINELLRHVVDLKRGRNR